MASEVSWNPGLWSAAGGAIPEGWNLVPFETFLESPRSMSVGVMYPGDNVVEGIPLVRVGDVADGGVVGSPSMSISAEVHHEYRRTELQGNELLITLVGKPGVCVIVRPHMKGWNVARALAAARLKDPEIRPFIKAVLESNTMKNIVLSMLNTTVQPTLNLKEIRSLPVPFPADRSVAIEIGNVAEEFNQRIALLKDSNNSLERIVSAIFESWFIRFDPVRAKSEGREPEGMSADIAALFSSEFVDSELGPIPRGWSVGRFSDVASLAKGSVNPGKEPNREFRHFSLPAFDGRRLPTVELGESIKSNKTIVPSNAVLQSKLNPHIPRIWFVGDAGDDAICSTEFLPWVTTGNSCPEFVYCLLRSDAFIAGVQSLVTGTSNSHQRVRPDQVSQLSVVIPPVDVIRAFHAAVAPMVGKVLTNILQAKTLSEVRDSLLPRLLSGDVSILSARNQ